MNMDTALPPGQIERADFPRFGLRQFAQRFPVETVRQQLQIAGDVQHCVLLEAEFAQLPRVQQCSDFHCVTTWTHRSLQWSGFRFADLSAVGAAAGGAGGPCGFCGAAQSRRLPL